MVKVFLAAFTGAVAQGSPPPMDGKDVAAYLNEQYTGWDIENKSSVVGVVARMTKEWRFYCDHFADSGCTVGRARCISSASILNNQVMIKPGGVSAIGLQRSTGIIFNTSMVENRLGRCSYQYDGGSLGRLNRGCGTMTENGHVGDCENKKSAWFNLDPKTGKECTDKSDAVLDDYCPVRIANGNEPKQSGEPACFWKGPAFYPRNGWIESESHEMLKQRVRNQNGTDKADLQVTWDEVVLDSELLYEELVKDPARVVPAMIYHWSKDARKTKIAKEAANKMALAMQAEFKMSAPVPLVAVDITANVQNVTRPLFFYGQRPNPTGKDLCCFSQSRCNTDLSACDGAPKYCALSEQNCAGCQGTWCPAALDDDSVLV